MKTTKAAAALTLIFCLALISCAQNDLNKENETEKKNENIMSTNNSKYETATFGAGEYR